MGVEAQHPAGSPGGAEEVEQQTDGGGLAGSVGTEVPEDLSLAHLEIEIDDPQLPPVELRQAPSLDRQGHPDRC